MNNNLTKRLISSLIILPITLLFIINGSLFFMFFLSILFLVTSYEWMKMTKRKILYKSIGIIFLIFSFYSAFVLRTYAGLNFFLFIILISIFTDIGGYIFGNFFKGQN